MIDMEWIKLKEFGLTIRKRREILGLTQLKLSEYVDCSIQHMGNVERGLANTSLVMLYRIAAALKVPAKELL